MKPIPTTTANGHAPAFELKSAGFTLPIIRLLVADQATLASQLDVKVKQAPEFFRNTPIVIDLGGLATTEAEIEFPMLVGLLRGHGMLPFGVRGGSDRHHAAARAMELAVLGESRVPRDKVATPAPTRPAPRPAPEGPVEPPPPGGYRLITKPIRSGQCIHAPEGDLSVVGAVSSGAELLAEGNIHIYGPLRGRAIAGMNGNVEARIFCLDLQAELVSIAGHYRVSENIPVGLSGVPVQIFLEGQALRIEPLS